MKSLRPTIIALILTLMVSSTAVAGNIGMRSAGNIGMRSAGNIGMRSAGNIPMRGAGIASAQGTGFTSSPEISRFNLESEISGNFAGLIQMLLNAGALL